MSQTERLDHLFIGYIRFQKTYNPFNHTISYKLQYEYIPVDIIKLCKKYIMIKNFIIKSNTEQKYEKMIQEQQTLNIEFNLKRGYCW